MSGLDDLERALCRGAEDTVTKPLDPSELSRKVKKALT